MKVHILCHHNSTKINYFKSLTPSRNLGFILRVLLQVKNIRLFFYRPEV